MRLSAVIFIRKIWSKSVNNGIVYNRIGFKCICTTISRQHSESFSKPSFKATGSGRSMGGCNSKNILPINTPKCHAGKVYVFWQDTLKIVRILSSGTWSLPFHYGYCWNHEHFIQERHNHRKAVSPLKFLEKRKRLRFTLQRKDLVLHFLVPVWDTLSEVM